jgi:nucleoside-diphosphate-sugar epimerase
VITCCAGLNVCWWPIPGGMAFASRHGAAGMLSAGIGAPLGNQTRTFLHVSDCVHGILLILEGEAEQPCNLGSAELVSVSQPVDVIEESAGVRLKRRYNLAAATGVRGRTSDNARLRQASGWEPSVALRAGMAGTYQWVADQVSARTLTGRRG